MNGGADISECGTYRYRLYRDWSEDGGCCLFVMLNPSTADAEQDDPTIRKCMGFAKRWGYGRIMVVNLFAFRSTKPRGLLDVADPVGPDNDVFIREEAEAASRIVFAWGSHLVLEPRLSTRAWVVRKLLGGHWRKTVVLGRCKDGKPRHPLMLAYDVEPGHAYSGLERRP